MNETTLDWLLEDDPASPGVRYLTLRDLVGLAPDDPTLLAAHAAVMDSGPVPAILAAQDEQGWWVQPHPAYYPKYTGTVWSLIQLAWLGADGRHPAIQAACEHLLSRSISRFGRFSADGSPPASIHCLEGNLVWALIQLGAGQDPRLQRAVEWLARSITGDGIAPAEDKQAAPRYYRSGNCAPGFACSANDGLPCAWGAARALLALAAVPSETRSPAVQAAIAQGVDFLFSIDPASAAYPSGGSAKPSRSWFQLQAVPLGYVTDVLLVLEVLVALGYRHDPRLAASLDWLRLKADQTGRWKQEYTFNGKTWIDLEAKGQPSKWTTLRAMRVLADE